jgi:hypothetical protein
MYIYSFFLQENRGLPKAMLHFGFKTVSKYGCRQSRFLLIDPKGDTAMQLHTGADHFGNVIKRGIIKRGCS